MDHPVESRDQSPDGRSWERYRLIAAASSDVVYQTDAEGAVHWISPSVTALLGWDPEYWRGRPARELFHPYDVERVAAIHLAVLAQGHPHDAVPCMMRTSTGGYRAVTLHARAHIDVVAGDRTAAAGAVTTGVIVVVSDTQDTEAALRALATLSQANRTLVRASDEGALLQQMCDTIVRTGRYQFAWYGRPIDDAEKSVLPIASAGADQGYLDEIRISWGDGPLGQGPTGRCLRTRRTHVSNDFRPDPDYQPWVGAATRRGFQCSISLPVVVGDRVDGALMVYAAEAGSFDALAQDLLEDLAADLGYGLDRIRKTDDLARTTRETQQQRERLQATLDSQFDPFVLLDGVRDDDGTLVDLRFVEANAAAVAYHRVPREQLIGARLTDMPSGHLDLGPLQMYFACIETGVSIVLDDYAADPEIVAEARWHDIRGVKSGDAVALTWRDVTDRHAAATRLATSEHRYRLLAENSSDVILLSDQQMDLSWVSPSALQTFGMTPDQMVGHAASEFIHPDDLPHLRDAVRRSDTEGQPIRVRYRWRCADGSYRWVEARGRPIDDDGTGHPGRVVGLRDIDAQVQAEVDLAAREERFRLLAENASDVVWQIAPDGVLVWVSPAITKVLGWRSDQVLGTVAMDLIHPDDQVRAKAVRDEVIAGRSLQGEFRVLRADGTTRWMALAVHPVPTGDGTVRIIALRDIEDEVAARRQLEFALGHDQLTGLATRHSLLDRLAHVMDQLGRWHVVGVLCVGIDALSEINEALTHAAGDIVLTTVAARLARATGNPDLVGRGSGDEFLILLPDLASGADGGVEAERLRVAAQGAISVGSQEVFPTVSVGIAIGGDGVEPDQLLRDASLALRKAKNGGRDTCEFADPGLAVEAQHRLSLESDLRDALRDGEIVPWFQPIVDLATGDCVGYEALARWVRPGEVILPVTFIPIAERTALIHDIDLSVMRQSVTALAQLPPDAFVSVNVTVATLARTPYADLVVSACADAGVDPARLHLEVTETMLLDPNERVTAAIQRLADLGVRWYIDDFGTGYASITSLRDLPMAGIKLDHSFTFGIARGDTTSMQLARALVGLAKGLQLDTVAEGIESSSQAEVLRALGWRHGQGWLFGKAQPLPDSATPESCS